jgi:osmotically-inducible protein OsmY
MSTLTKNSQSHLTDKQTQDAVEAELDWTPGIHAPAIGVAVSNGVVTLSGEVRSYAERLAAKQAALRTVGVTAVADDVLLQVVANVRHTDTDIAKAVHHVLTTSTDVPPTAVKAQVSNQVVTLTGEVDWNYQRDAARRAVQYLAGVRGVENQIRLSARVSAADAEERIRRAFTRSAILDAGGVKVSVHGTVATLTGTVRTWQEKMQAGVSTWSSPNITAVHNELHVAGY